MDYPNDADGDALRRVASDGSDMNRPMEIDFHVDAPDKGSSELIAKAASATGYQVSIYNNEEYGDWTVECSKSMVPEYKAINECQVELDEISQPHGGHIDGWGTFGNVEPG